MLVSELTARVAFTLYLHRGRQPGRAHDDWVTAESIVDLCLATAQATSSPPAPLESAPEAAPETAPEPAPEAAPEAASEPIDATRSQAKDLLHTAADKIGRKQVAARLGYKSASTVGRYLRGDREINDDLATRILENLTSGALRRAG